MKKISLLALVGLTCHLVIAQNANLAFPSANNSFLSKIGISASSGVDLHTGTAQVSVPVCGISSRELTIPVSLSYTGSRGIKIQDYATCVGLGWRLNAGGSISRVVRGLPDEFPNGYLGTGQWGQQVANNGINSTALPVQVTGANNGFTTPTADGEPDIFFVSTPFTSFQFSFDASGNPILSNNNGAKVIHWNFYNSTSYQNCSFRVIDEAGNEYNFGGTSSEVEKTTTNLFGTSYTFPTTWYLSNIYSFNAKDVIQFSYATSPNPETTYHYRTAYTTDYADANPSTDNTPNTYVISAPKYLSVIQTYAGKIEFNYAYDRRDIVNAPRLTNIVVKAYDEIPWVYTTLSTYHFNYTYFGDPTADINLLRLKLDNISESGNTTATATPVVMNSFTYNTATSLPARNSQHFDFFGYYKYMPPAPPGTPPVQAQLYDPMKYPPIRAANEANTKATILTMITNRGGGTTQYNYELNEYYDGVFAMANVKVGGLRIQSIAKNIPGGTAVTQTFNYNSANGNSNGQVFSNLYQALQYTCNGGNNWTNYSEAPSTYYDINGNFVGYSSVKLTEQNGGYSVSNFTNFSDYPDLLNGAIVGGNAMPLIASTTSFGYKRGLLTSDVTYSATGAKISSNNYTYTSLTSPTTKNSYAFRWYVLGYGTCAAVVSSKYYTPIENYRLSAVTHKDHDQLNDNNFVQTVTSYTYCPNKRHIRSVSNTDSKGATITKTFYHADDTGIPMVTSPEQTAINNLITANRTNAMVHEVDTKGSLTTQVHNIYGTNIGGPTTRVFLTGVANYKGSTVADQFSMTYDDVYCNLLSSNSLGGKPTAVGYDFNETQLVAKVVNASSFWGTYASTQSGSGGGTFASDYTGMISIGVNYSSGSGTYRVNYNLIGPSPQSGSLCFSTVGGCSGTPQSIGFPNMPAGSYTLSVSTVTNTFPTVPGSSYTYPKNLPKLYHEYYYESFEAGGTPKWNAHTGNRYFPYTSGTPYSITYTPPNSRNYVIQWWNWVNGKWLFNEEPYTGPRSIHGVIDDVRVFPADAQMTTFTYNPLVGKTGEIDPSGRTLTYEYDGLGRLNIVRDNDKNILSKSCYNYAGQTVNCPTASTWTNPQVMLGFARNDCGPGYVATPVNYVVPAGIYSSTISPDDALQQAWNDVYLNGQTFANNPANGSLCNIPINYNNQTPVIWTVTATRVGPGTVYNSTLSANLNAPLSISLPPGTYNIVFTCGSQTMSTPPSITVNGVTQNASTTTNVTLTFNNVSVSTSSTNPLITAVLQSGGPCSFTANAPFGIGTSGISASGGVVSFYIVLYFSGSPSWSSANTVATVQGGCRPSANRTFNKTDASGRTWEIVVQTNGLMSIRLLSGTPPASGNTINISGGSYNL